MSINLSTLLRQLEEIHLLKCSLLPGESITFDPDFQGIDEWSALLDSFSQGGDTAQLAAPSSPARFRIRAENRSIWFDVELPTGYRDDDSSNVQLPVVAVRGDELGRTEQEQWQVFMREALLEELKGAEYVCGRGVFFSFFLFSRSISIHLIISSHLIFWCCSSHLFTHTLRLTS